MPRALASSGVDRDARLALAAHEHRLRREGRVQEVVRGRRDEREREALGERRRARRALARRDVAGQRVDALGGELVGDQLAAARGGREAALGERQVGIRHAQAHRRLALEPLEGDPGHARVVPVERLARHLLVRLAQARVVEPHARGEAAEELGVRERLAERRDRRAAEADVEVPVGLVDVVVLERRGGRQQQVGEVRGVGLELLVDDREQVLAREAARGPTPARARRRRGSSCRRRAPSRAARAPRPSRMRPSWLMLSVRVPGRIEVGPLERPRCSPGRRPRSRAARRRPRRARRRPRRAGRRSCAPPSRRRRGG